MSTPYPQNRPPWLDHGLRRTNPVHIAGELCRHLERQFVDDFGRGTRTAQEQLTRQVCAWAAEGGRLPDFAVRRLIGVGALPPDFRLEGAEPRPGVLGLVVDQGSGRGLVLPLRPEPSRAGWRIEPSLPFGPEDLQDALVRLVHGADIPTAGVIPERLAYAFDNPLGQRVQGNSMTVAALLAVLDVLGGRSAELFRAACAVVEMRPDGRLVGVAGIEAKLQAALREHGRLSLVVCPPDCKELASFDRVVLGEIWAVECLADLASRLQKADVLARLLQAAPLQRPEAIRVRDRLRWLVRQEHRYEDAAELGDRLRGCPRQEPVEPAVWAEVAVLSAEACRHQGRFTDAVSLGGQILTDVAALGSLTSDDEEADASAEYAAALYDSHEFERIPLLLEPWAEVATCEPRRLRPLTRVKVWNTLARGLVILNRDGWERLFRKSLELNRRLEDPDNVNRTLSYLVHGLVRHGRAADAQAALEEMGLRRDPLPHANPWLGVMLAGVARCAGERWHHPELDRARVETHGPKHACGFYFQATARQPRDREDVMNRLNQAAAFMRAEAGDSQRNICVLFAVALDLAIAAQSRDPERWAIALTAIHRFLADELAAPLRAYYARVTDHLPPGPDTGAAEQFLRRIPYF